jgi:peptide/nickel transport system permease protein
MVSLASPLHPRWYLYANRSAEVFRAVRADRLLLVGCVIALVAAALVVIGPTLAPYDPQTPTARAVPPASPAMLVQAVSDWLTRRPANRIHILGTDDSGLDVFSRIVAAPRVDVTVAISATILSAFIGSALGLVAGFYQNWGTEVLVRVSDVTQSFPAFILAMILVTLVGRSAGNILLVLAVVFVPIYLRLTRSQVLSQRRALYVEASRAIGNREIVTALKHVLPNSLGPTLIQAPISIGWAILLTSGLSFIGAGVRPPTPEWGSMIALGAGSIIVGEWWPSFFAGVAISVTVFGFALLGSALERRYG